MIAFKGVQVCCVFIMVKMVIKFYKILTSSSGPCGNSSPTISTAGLFSFKVIFISLAATIGELFA